MVCIQYLSCSIDLVGGPQHTVAEEMPAPVNCQFNCHTSDSMPQAAVSVVKAGHHADALRAAFSEYKARPCMAHRQLMSQHHLRLTCFLTKCKARGPFESCTATVCHAGDRLAKHSSN